MKIFKDCWHDLVKMSRNNTFSPNQEQDIICMMYHLCLEKLKDPKLIHASSGWNYDLILGKVIGEKKKEMQFRKCLLAEFKFILTKGRKHRRLKAAIKDIKKLSETGDHTVRRIFAMFDKVNCLQPGEIQKLVHSKDKVTVFFAPT